MATTVYHHLLDSKFWIVAVSNKTSVLSQEGVFANLCFKIVDSTTNLIEDGSLESHVLYHVHFRADLFLCSFITDETGTSTREETLWILAKEKNASGAYLLVIIYFCYEIVILSQVLHGRFAIANNLNVVVHKVHVNIIDGCSIYILVLIVAFALVIKKLHSLIKVEFLTLITNAHEAFVRLIGVELTAGRDMNEENAVFFTFGIFAWKVFASNFYRRIAEVEWYTEQIVKTFFIAINALYSSRLVRYTDSKHTTICISHCHYWNR